MPPAKAARSRVGAVLHRHALSIVTVGMLGLWIVLFAVGDPNTHWGAFFGNAVADWSGSVVLIVGTKYLVERGSAESRQPKDHLGGFRRVLFEHSLTIFLVVTGIVWAILFARADVNSKWGQVTGNIASEWVQMIGIVYLTKSLIERGSKESK